MGSIGQPVFLTKSHVKDYFYCVLASELQSWSQDSSIDTNNNIIHTYESWDNDLLHMLFRGLHDKVRVDVLLDVQHLQTTCI